MIDASDKDGLRVRARRLGLRSIALRVLVLIMLWCAVMGTDADALAFGVPVVTAALLLSIALSEHAPCAWSARGLARLAFVFAEGSLLGGFDVARRALAPKLSLAPKIVVYKMRLIEGSGRDLFTAILTMMPGTLSGVVRGHELHLHTLFMHTGVQDQLVRLEDAVAAAIGAHLESHPQGKEQR